MGKLAAITQKTLDRNQLRIRCRYLLWRQDFILSLLQVENLQPHVKTCCHNSRFLSSPLPVATRLSRVSCGDKIPSCLFCKLKTCCHTGKPAATTQKTLARNQLRIRCRYLLWRQDFILSLLQVGNLQPHVKTCCHGLKTCTHNSKNLGSESVEDQMPVSLVATRFHLVSSAS